MQLENFLNEYGPDIIICLGFAAAPVILCSLIYKVCTFYERRVDKKPLDKKQQRSYNKMKK